MPARYGVDVSITDTNEHSLAEYGSQGLGAYSKFSKLISTRIEAKDGQQFYIRVTPEIPFSIPAIELAAGINATSSKDRFFSLPPLASDNYWLRHRVTGFNENSAVEEEEDQPCTKDTQGTMNLRPRIKTQGRPFLSATSSRFGGAESLKQQSVTANSAVHVPFDLMVSVYIDGYEKPEARQIIYLDQSHPKFSKEGYTFKGRWISSTTSSAKDKESYIEIRNWIFRSVPLSVDDLTSRMAICSTTDDQAPVVRSDEEQALEDLTKQLTQNKVNANAEPKPGQIEVRIRRIITGEAVSGVPFKAYHYAGSDEAVKPSDSDIKGGCTHTTQHRPELDDEGKPKPLKLNTVSWKHFKNGEDFYAKFVFSYMDRTKLVKLGLCDENGTPTTAEKCRTPQLDSVLTPSKLRKRKEDDKRDIGEATRRKRIGSLPANSSLTQANTATTSTKEKDDTGGSDLIS